jgi:hypothetical protein
VPFKVLSEPNELSFISGGALSGEALAKTEAFGVRRLALILTRKLARASQRRRRETAKPRVQAAEQPEPWVG